MANTNVFRGSDAKISFAPSDPSQVEGQASNEIIEEFEVSTVGRATDVEVYVTTDLKAFHEIGKRHPSQLRPGNINVSGKVGRAYINGALLRLLLGQGALVNRVGEPYAQPSFNISILIEDPATPGNTNTLTVHQAKFDDWAYALPEDDFVMESVTFQGMFVTVEDTEG
ncbi:MAG: hypothetical protein PVH18_12965 [Chloroflexota bacterium]|jgi:hypothetical protein